MKQKVRVSQEMKPFLGQQLLKPSFRSGRARDGQRKQEKGRTKTVAMVTAPVSCSPPQAHIRASWHLDACHILLDILLIIVSSASMCCAKQNCHAMQGASLIS